MHIESQLFIVVTQYYIIIFQLVLSKQDVPSQDLHFKILLVLTQREEAFESEAFY